MNLILIHIIGFSICLALFIIIIKIKRKMKVKEKNHRVEKALDSLQSSLKFLDMEKKENGDAFIVFVKCNDYYSGIISGRTISLSKLILDAMKQDKDFAENVINSVSSYVISTDQIKSTVELLLAEEFKTIFEEATNSPKKNKNSRKNEQN